MSEDRVMPHDLEAERAVLGSVCLDPNTLDVVAQWLSPKDFFRTVHQDIYAAMMTLALESRPIDVVTLAAYFRGKGTLDDIGGPAYLASLVSGLVRLKHIEGYAQIVANAASRRRVISVAHELIDAAYSGKQPTKEIVDTAGGELFALGRDKTHGDLVPMSALMGRTMDMIERHAQGDQKVVGLTTGFTGLDVVLGGLQPGQFIIIASRPGIGKSSIALNVVHHNAQQQHYVALFSLEMSTDELMVRYLAGSAEVSGRRLLRGSLTEIEYRRVADAIDPMTNATVYIDDTARLTMFELRAKARAMKRKVGLSLVVLDYIQLMPGDAKLENRQRQLEEISRNLKILAKELEIPIIALSQLTRGEKDRAARRPMLSDLKGSGALEQDADKVLLIYNEEKEGKATEKNKGKAEIIVAKNRGGPSGTIILDWIADQTRFANITSGELYQA